MNWRMWLGGAAIFLLGAWATIELPGLAHAQTPAGWIDAGEGFYYQTPVLAGGEGPLAGQTIATIQIQSQSADLTGAATFHVIVFSTEGRIVAELTKNVSGFTPGASLIIDFPLRSIDRDTIGRVVLRTEFASRAKPGQRK